MATKHPVVWRAPAPLWNLALADGGTRPRFQQPALLRFDSDTFMEDTAAVLATDPAQLSAYVAKPERWEAPDAGWAAPGDATLNDVLKLFQPAQNRFYLAAASLICQRTGLPERKVDIGAGETVGLLMRRLIPLENVTFDPNDPDTYAEHAWIGDRENGQWQVATTVAARAEGEELLPMFPLTFTFEGKTRRLLVGGIPSAGRELYETRAPSGLAAEPLVSTPDDPLLAFADQRKAAWAQGPGLALRTYASTKDLNAMGVGTEMSAADAREVLAYALLDMVDFFRAQLGVLWNGIESRSGAGLDASAQAIYNALGATIVAGLSWREALRRTDARRDVLLLGADPAPGTQDPVPDTLSRATIATAANQLVNESLTDLNGLIFAALDNVEPANGTPPPGGAPTAAAEAAARSAGDGSFYAVRCVYERPRCKQYRADVVSPLSRPFRLAAFYDPDAPARPVTIRMPNTGLGSIARFPKGVSMVLSDDLRQKVDALQMSKLGDIDDGNIEDKPSWGIGMICSLSIPIITLCAFIVLMIFVQLLNIVFWWLPFLRICLPIPVRKD